MYNKSLSVLVFFILINALIFIFKNYLVAHGFDTGLLLGANLILFVLGLTGFFIQMKALQSKNINAFLRGIYISLLLKIFIVIIALAVYLFATKGKINRPSLFTSMLLYIVYTYFEVRQLMKTSRKKTDA